MTCTNINYKDTCCQEHKIMNKIIYTLLSLIFAIHMNAQCPASDLRGDVLDFDGTNDYVNMGSPNLGISTTATFSAWIYPRAGNGVIAMQGFSHAGSEHGWVVAIGWDGWGSSETATREIVWASHNQRF